MKYRHPGSAAPRYRLVFNITQCVDGDRRHDHAIAATLGMFGIRYTGSGAFGITRDQGPGCRSGS